MSSIFDSSMLSTKSTSKSVMIDTLKALGLYDGVGVGYQDFDGDVCIVGTNNLCYSSSNWSSRNSNVGLLGYGIPSECIMLSNVSLSGTLVDVESQAIDDLEDANSDDGYINSTFISLTYPDYSGTEGGCI